MLWRRDTNPISGFANWIILAGGHLELIKSAMRLYLPSNDLMWTNASRSKNNMLMLIQPC